VTHPYYIRSSKRPKHLVSEPSTIASDAEKAKQTTGTTYDIMVTILDWRKSNGAIQETNKVIQDSIAALEIRL
jgi:hypothetical protein